MSALESQGATFARLTALGETVSEALDYTQVIGESGATEIERTVAAIGARDLPPGVVAAASRALDLIANDREFVRKPLALAREFTAALDLPPAESPIVSIVLGGAERALAASAELRRAGFLVAAIRPPTVPAGTSRLRLTARASLTDEQLDTARRVLARVLTGSR